MFAHIKMQVEKPQMAESGFTADQIMHLYKIFHKLWLTQGNSYIKDSKKEGSDKLKIMMNSAFNRQLYQNCITKGLKIILRELACYNIKITTTSKELCFL